MKIVLTGATGFVGGRALEVLPVDSVVVVGRSRPSKVAVNNFYRSEFNAASSFSKSLSGADVVVHCAARAHVMKDEALNPLTEYRKVNTAGTLNLARQAAASGVRRFVFISSIKVNGESTEVGIPFLPEDGFIPIDHYALSKYEAEIGLREIAEKTGMEIVIIRPPLIYGPGVKANFFSMMCWVNRGLPLPLGGVRGNKRSLVFIDNLVDLIRVCLSHPKAANQTFLVSDDADLSTAELLSKMSMALGVSDRTLSIPVSWIQLAAKLLGRSVVAQRLCASLQVDISKTKKILGWQPPFTVEQGLRSTAEVFLKVRS